MSIETHRVALMPEGLMGARALPSLVRRLRRLRPTVFHAHLNWPIACKYGLAAALAARVPAVIGTVHLFVDAPIGTGRRVQQRLLGRGVDQYIAVSEHVATCLRAHLPWPADKITVVPNGVDALRAPAGGATALRREVAGSAAVPLVLTVARLSPEKGHPYLLEAAREVPNAVFGLVGDGRDRPKLEAMARSLGVSDRVRFLGRRSDVGDLLAVADLFVLPSLYEGLPLSVLEAMSLGVPVIASRIGGTDEAVVNDETGLLVDPGDSRGLATAIRSLLERPEEARRFGNAGRERMQREFTAAVMAERTQEVYARALAARRRS